MKFLLMSTCCRGGSDITQTLVLVTVSLGKHWCEPGLDKLNAQFALM